MRVIHCAGDLVQDAIGVCQRIMIPETEHPIPSFDEKLSTPLIRLSLKGVLTPIELYHDATFRATEVHDVAADRMLPAKLGTIHLSGTQAYPQLVFGISLLTPQTPSPDSKCYYPIRHAVFPYPNLVPSPSPLRGEGAQAGPQSGLAACHAAMNCSSLARTAFRTTARRAASTVPTSGFSLHVIANESMARSRASRISCRSARATL